jgi:UDP-N-acetylmuramoyl-tripeptide--D-alanyl-D-alanine ligase
VSAFPLGEIAKQAKILRPDIAIVTTIGNDHFKIFRSLEATAREKGQLVEALPPGGVAILNADDPNVKAMAARTPARVVTYGLCPDADIRASDVTGRWPDRLALTVSYGADSLRVQTRLVGEHWTVSVLAAIACGLVCDVDLQACVKAVASQQAAFGRFSVHSAPDKPVYVLDTKKAPYYTMAIGLEFVERARASHKTIVIGTMSDYAGSGAGKYRKVARMALAVADRVVFVGPRAGHVSKLRQGDLRNRLHCFESTLQASTFLALESRTDELIYIKASSTDHLERIMLSQIDRVVCWRERCGRKTKCQECTNFRKPSRPPRHTLTPELRAILANA